MLPNFVLVGFMGCGKTTVGRRLASMTGHRFVDADELIVKDQKKSISAIFAEKGEEGFREIEERVIADLVGVAGIILSTGGGAILREANRISLKKIGIIIWLDAQPEVLFERAIRSGRRPLLQMKTRAKSSMRSWSPADPSTNPRPICASTPPASITTRSPGRFSIWPCANPGNPDFLKSRLA